MEEGETGEWGLPASQPKDQKLKLGDIKKEFHLSFV